jgi:hypothetical protein
MGASRVTERKIFISVTRPGLVVTEISYDLWIRKRPIELVAQAIDNLIAECDQLDQYAAERAISARKL